MQPNILQSGGAVGADTYWCHLAEEAGHDVRNFVHEHMPKSIPHAIVLSRAELVKQDDLLKSVAKTLGRQFPTRNEYVNNLIRRNVYQIIGTSVVYAVADILFTNHAAGGTGWAVELAKMVGLPIYVLDKSSNVWYTWNHWLLSDDYRDYWKYCDDVPPPRGIWTGIGSRDINATNMAQMKAIMKKGEI